MKTIAFLSQKGGTGKSTLALAVAVEAERRGKRVVIVDLDPQTSATNWSDRRGKDRPTVVSCQVSRLAPVLEAAAKEGADLVLIDSPGKSAEAAIAAAKVADLALLPIQPALIDLETLAGVKDILALAGKPSSAVVINRAPTTGRRHAEALEAIPKLYGLEVCPVVIHARAAHSDASNHGLTAAEIDAQSKAAQEISALYSYIAIGLKGERHGKGKIVRRGN